MRLHGASLPKGPSLLDVPDLLVSGSHWNERHLKALRVINIDDQPLNRLIPEEHIPSNNHPGKLPDREVHYVSDKDV
jgi:hypothetical protein